MIREWLAGQATGLAPAMVTVAFVLIFAGVLVWIFRPGSARQYERQARLPLNDGAPAVKSGPRTHG
jgi:cbb3-type cytochrome oxidase subunit 3